MGSVLPPLVLVHGMWCPPAVWENYKPVFEKAGFEVHTPALRFHDCDPSKGAPEGIGHVSMKDYVDDLEEMIGGLDQKPILIGHSLGGLVALMAVSRGLARGAILLTPAPPAGISVFKSSAVRVFIRTLLTFGFWRKGVFPSVGEMSIVLNMMSRDEVADLYTNIVWESGRVVFETVCWSLDRAKTTAIPYNNIHTPMLIVGATKDNLTPPSAVRKMAHKLSHTASYQEFPENGHWVLGEPGWEVIADRCVSWIKQNII